MKTTYDIKVGDIVQLNDDIIRLMSWPKPELTNFKQDFRVIHEYHFTNSDRPLNVHHAAIIEGIQTNERTSCSCGYLLKDGQSLKWKIEHKNGMVITG